MYVNEVFLCYVCGEVKFHELNLLCVSCSPMVTHNSLNDFFLSLQQNLSNTTLNNGAKHHNIGYSSQESEVRTALNCSGTLKSSQWWRCWQLLRKDVSIAH